MWCGKHGTFEYLGIETRLILPHIECIAMSTFDHCTAIDNSTARGVKDDRIGAHNSQQALIDKMVCRAIERCMQRDDVGIASNVPDIVELATLALLSWWIALQYPKAPVTGIARHEATHITNAHNAQCTLLWSAVISSKHMSQRSSHPLHDSTGITPRSRAHLDACTTAICLIYMVTADGGRGNELHARTLEQRTVATGTGTNDERIGIAHYPTVDGCTLDVGHIGPRLDDASDIGDGTIYDDFHGVCDYGVKFLANIVFFSEKNIKFARYFGFVKI